MFLLRNIHKRNIHSVGIPVLILKNCILITNLWLKSTLIKCLRISGKRYFCHPVFREAFKALEIMATATVAASTAKTWKKQTLSFMIPLNNGGHDIKKLNALLAILQFSINSEAFLEIHLQTLDSTTRMEQSSKKLASIFKLCFCWCCSLPF